MLPLTHIIAYLYAPHSIVFVRKLKKSRSKLLQPTNIAPRYLIDAFKTRGIEFNFSYELIQSVLAELGIGLNNCT